MKGAIRWIFSMRDVDHAFYVNPGEIPSNAAARAIERTLQAESLLLWPTDPRTQEYECTWFDDRAERYGACMITIRPATESPSTSGR